MTDPQKVTIVSDGTAEGTQVLIGETVMKHVLSVDIEPVLPFGRVQATIKVHGVALRMQIAKAHIECDDPAAKAAIQSVLDNMAEKTGN